MTLKKILTIRSLVHIIDNNYKQKINFKVVSGILEISQSSLNMYCMEVMNTTPQEYLDYRRLEEAKKTKGTFEEKAVAVGYIDTSHMTKACSRTHNLTLNEFFKKENT